MAFDALTRVSNGVGYAIWELFVSEHANCPRHNVTDTVTWFYGLRTTTSYSTLVVANNYTNTNTTYKWLHTIKICACLFVSTPNRCTFFTHPYNINMVHFSS